MAICSKSNPCPACISAGIIAACLADMSNPAVTADERARLWVKIDEYERVIKEQPLFKYFPE